MAIQTLLRDAQQRAVAEKRMMCVDIDLPARSYALLTGSCGSKNAEPVQGPFALAPTSGDGLRDLQVDKTGQVTPR